MYVCKYVYSYTRCYRFVMYTTSAVHYPYILVAEMFGVICILTILYRTSLHKRMLLKTDNFTDFNKI